jgi:sterol desaturase/sphingolipid hydroxylase (fatty acid hydroxylase superfamily)
VPFPTSLLAEFLEQPSATVAMAIYAGLHVVLALAFNGLWRYAAYKRRLLGRAVTERQISVVNRAFLIGPMLYLLAFLLAFVNVFASFGLCAALAIFFAITSVE